MIKEIHKAVETFHKIAFGNKQNAGKVSESKLATFITILTELLTARYQKNWYPDNPDRGNGYRCIRVNSQCVDPTVVESMKQAKIDIRADRLVLIELTIWVDPGVVSVRIGEDGSIGSEIVDEDVYNSSKLTKETPLKRSGSESDEGFSSSRSSSPESESSWSSCSSVNSSPFPSKRATPSASSFSRYSPPVHVTYPSHHQRSTTPVLSSRFQRNHSPTTSYFQPGGGRAQARSSTPFSPLLSTLNGGDFSGSAQGHIPNSASSQRVTSYTRPRALFSVPDSSSPSSKNSLDSAMKITLSSYHGSGPILYGSHLQQPNFCDIPAMA